jgi:DNA primase
MIPIKVNNKWINMEELKSMFDLTEFYGEGKVPCWLHDDRVTPNLQVYPDHAYCFACGKAIDTVGFIMHMEGLNFPDAVEFMQKNKHKVRITRKTEAAPIDMNVLDYWCVDLLEEFRKGDICYLRENRGLYDESLIRELRLGVIGADSISIPHFVNGVVENIKFRNLSREPKYDSLKDREFTHLWPWDYFRTKFGGKFGVLFITEGEFDCMLLLQAGLPAVSVPSGCNTDLGKFIPFLKQFQHIYLCYDLDEAGFKAVDRVFDDKMKTGYTLAEMIGTKITHLTWPWQWGEDITDARDLLIPEIVNKYRLEVG